jgi:hypothetical protein
MARPAPHRGRIAISVLIVGAVAGVWLNAPIQENGPSVARCDMSVRARLHVVVEPYTTGPTPSPAVDNPAALPAPSPRCRPFPFEFRSTDDGGCR